MKRQILICTCALAVCACSEKAGIPIEPKPVASFKASVEAHTRMAIDEEYSLSWGEGDEILVYDGGKSSIFKASAPGDVADFTSVGMIVSENKTYRAVFPASQAEPDGSSMKVEVLSGYEALPDAYPCAPAVAVTDGVAKEFTFRNLCGLLSFSVTGGDVKSLTFEGLDGEVLAGKLAVEDFAEASYKVLDGSASVTVSAEKRLSPGKYYVAVLPQNFGKGLKVTIGKTDGNSVEKVYDPFVLGRSRYVDLEKLDEGRFLRYVISDAEQLQAFLDDAPACEPYVTATLAEDIALGGVQLRPASSFKGHFDGDGHSLHGWSSCEPLFAVLEETAVVENLNIGVTCTLTAGSTGRFAPLAGINRGRISSCVNYADISGTDTAEDCLVAGIAAMSYGSIDNCVNRGVISVSGKASGIGGIVARFDKDPGEPALSGCTNDGGIIAEGEIKVIGGIAARGNSGAVRSCKNDGAVQLKLSSTLDSIIVGGVIGKSTAGVENCSNASDVSADGSATVFASVGGVAGISEGASVQLRTCVHSGSISADVSAAQVNVGGVVGYSSVPVGGSSKSDGKVSVRDNAPGKVYAGGVIGRSISTFDTIYNNGEVSVEVGADGGQVMLGGVAGFMDNSRLPAKSLITGQNNGSVKLSGGLGNESKEVFYIAGVVGNTTIPNVSHTNTNWATCNTNHGSIEVNVPLTVYVGGVFGRVTGSGVTANTGNVTGAKNDGSITVNAPGPDSCIGGIVARHGRGRLGNANGFGQAAKGASITVTGADKSVSVGAYAGWVSSDNGGNYPGCCMYISGISCYGSVQAEGATAGVLIGKAQLTGNSTTNGIMLGSAASEKPKIASGFLFNGTGIDDPESETFTVNTFFGSIVPSATTNRNKTDGTSLKDKYYFCTAGGTAEVSYKDGIEKR